MQIHFLGIKIKQFAPTSLVLPVILILISIISSIKFIYSYLGFDEGVFVWTGYNILQGEIPYKDFLEIKPPVIFFANAIGLLVFGIDKFKIMPIAVTIVSVFFLYFSLTRFKINKLLSFILSLHYITIMFYLGFHHTLNDVETYGLSFTILGLSLLLWNTHSNETSKFDSTKYIAGIFFALSVMSKEPFVLAIIPVIINVFLYLYLNRQQYWFSHLKLTIFGGITVLIIFFIYLLINNATLDYLRTLKNSFIHSQTFSSQPQTFQYGLNKLTKTYYNFKMLSMLLPFYIFFLIKYKIGVFFLTNLFGIIAGAYAISIGHNYWDHNYLMGTAGLLTPVIFSASFISQKYSTYNLKSKLATIGLIIIFSLGPIINVCRNLAIDLKRKYVKTNYYPEQKITERVMQFSSQGDYILLKDNPFVYAFWKRKHPTKWSTMLDTLIPFYDGNSETDKLNRLKSEIESKLPKVIYIPPSQIPLDQNKHITQVIEPLLKKYNYKFEEPNLYILSDQ